VERFIDKHQAHITGTISCFDRILFKGHLPLGWPEAMEQLITRQGVLIKDFAKFVTRHSEKIKRHAQAMAHRARRPFIHLNGPLRKEERARAILKHQPVREGLVCILTAVEACSSFKVVPGVGRPRLVPARRKCLCLYFYFLDREFGLLHIRITTWFPFMIQVYMNGHDWLARKLDRHGIAYRQLDNAFISIDDPPRAQRLADRFIRKNWPRILSAFARRVNPLLGNLLRGRSYYWTVEQAEFATDILFKSPAALGPLYDKCLQHATLCWGAEDVMTFLGRKLTGHFLGDVGHNYRRRPPGARVRHRLKGNVMKMYNKHGCVLRVETVINDPTEFKVRRRGTRRGRRITDWFPMRKGVANLYRYAEVSRAANRRYLHALAQPVRHQDRSYRGFNPACRDDVRLFAAVMRGEHLLKGFSNRDVRRHLCPTTRNKAESRRQAARVSRLLKRLHVHGLIAKIQRSRRWRVTHKGHALITMVLMLHDQHYPQALTGEAA